MRRTEVHACLHTHKHTNTHTTTHTHTHTHTQESPSDVHTACTLAAAIIRNGAEVEKGMSLLASVMAIGYQTVDSLAAYASGLLLGYRILDDDDQAPLERAADIYSKVESPKTKDETRTLMPSRS
jgi:hypothetical protein